MPLYEYACERCEARFERLASMSDADPARCPECGHVGAKRLLSVIAGTTGRAAAPAPVCGQGACGACS